ncbi:MAG: hypothetical protein HYU28_09230 [Actinobacteria bacterium]|nr:hypothetical protein [Actinomycetota bacterium]
MTRIIRLGAVAALVVFGFAACDSDDDTADEEKPAEEAAESEEGEEIDPEFAAYCNVVEEIDATEEFPSTEQLEELKSAAPEDIAAEVGAIVDAVIASEGNFSLAIADPDAQTAFNATETWEADNCGPSQAEPDLIEAQGDTEPAEGAEVIEATAVDFEFEGIPDEIEAGPIALAVTNEGPSAHLMSMSKLKDGVTFEEFLASTEGDPSEFVEEDLGFVTTPSVGDTRVINAEVDAGTYAFVCFLPGPEGAPHLALGMAGSFTVS